MRLSTVVRVACLVACLSLSAAVSARAAGPPTVTTGTNTFDGHGGTIVRGYVNPNGVAITDCSIEYGLTEAYGQSAPCAGRNEEQQLGVEATAGQFRLVFGGQSTPDIPFDAGPAVVQQDLEALPGIGTGNVMVAGGPGGQENTIYMPLRVHFTGALADRDVEQITVENGTEPLSGGRSAGATVTTTIQGGATGVAYLGSSGGEVTVDASGLTAGATYHFAVSATNSEGTTKSEDSVFAAPATAEEPAVCPNQGMPGAGFLPECRGWEMVSRLDKNGADVMLPSERVRVAGDGSAATYSTFTATNDALGTGITTEYLSERTGTAGTQGWTAHPITPAQPASSFSMDAETPEETHYLGEASSDLGTSVLQAWSPLTSDPFVGNVVNLYLRSDLLSSGEGSYRLISACPGCASAFPATDLTDVPRFDWASQDFKHILFESELPLTEGASGIAPRLYEWDEGTVRLAGIAPNGSPLPSSKAGNEDVGNYTLGVQRSISADGSKVFFTSPAYASSTGTGQLYMRTNASETVRLNRSERAVAEKVEPALFEDATADGSRVFFTSKQALTEDAPADGNAKLYMYDTTKPDSDPHNLTYLHADEVSGFIGASADGATVYFEVESQYIFVWHEGTVSFVASTTGYELSRNYGLGRQASVSENGDLAFGDLLPIGPTGYDQGSCKKEDSHDGLNQSAVCRELYLYRAATRSLNCISCNPSGAPGTSDALLNTQPLGVAARPSVREARSISVDGSRVFFSTRESLLPGDANDARDMYEYDSASGALRLISTGVNPTDSYFMGSTPDGRDVFFITRQRLAGWDLDGAYDLYDARVGGGFPEPPPAVTPCQGETCHLGYFAAPPSALSIGSQAVGPGNPPVTNTGPGKPKPPSSCPKARRRVRAHGRLRCVKPAHRKHRKRKNRRAGR